MQFFPLDMEVCCCMHLNCGDTLDNVGANVNAFFRKVFDGTKKKDLKTVFSGFKSFLYFREKINAPFIDSELMYKVSLLSL